jgi:hypothetical protein
MNEAIIRLGGFSIYGFGLLAVFAFLWGSFVFYKKANESHLDDSSVFDGVVLAAFWGFIIGRLSYVILNMKDFWNHLPRVLLLTDYPGIDRWGVLIGVALGIFFTTRRNKAKFVDWFDLVSLGISSGTAIFYFGLAILAFSWQYLVLGAVQLVLFIILWGMADAYRTFEWYRGRKTSARSGLISGFAISSWGLLPLLEKILFGRVTLVWILWGVALFVGGVVLVYIRSGRTWSEDIKIIFKHGRK